MDVQPFACIQPVPERAAEVAALPYDVFDRAEAAAAVEGRPLSFLNIDRPETQFEPGHDMYAPEVYERGAALLRAQIEAGVYVEKNPAFYLYELAQGGRSQTGIVATCAIDEYEDGTIKRHENTRPDKERDRIEHIRALGCQTGPIFLTYRDTPELDAFVRKATQAAPLYNFTDGEGVRQRVWAVDGAADVALVSALFKRVPAAYIADGHHRAASAVKVGQGLRAAAQAAATFTGAEPFNRFLSVLFPAGQLAILAYNRVVHDRAGLTAAELLDRVAAAGFEVAPAPGNAAVEPAEPGTMGLYTAGSWHILRYGPELASAVAVAGPVDALDVSVLQNRVLGPVLGIGDPRTDPRIEFVGGIRGTGELERRASGRAGTGTAEGVAFSMCATTIEQLLAVADAGLLMPPKSTWFEPKLRSGLFIHRIR